jgi:large subunit ribosomal protein L33
MVCVSAEPGFRGAPGVFCAPGRDFAKTLTLARDGLVCRATGGPATTFVGAWTAFPYCFSEGRIMAKAVTIKIKLVSSADTGFYYVAKKNSRTMTEKLVKKKYDPVAKKHVEFREAKIK